MFAPYPLIVYLLAGALGEVFGSVVRSPAEAIKTRVQAGTDASTADAFSSVLLTAEGRSNVFNAWTSSLFRDVPFGGIQLAVFEGLKAYLISSPIRCPSPHQFAHQVPITSSVRPSGAHHLISSPSRCPSPHQFAHQVPITSSVRPSGAHHLISSPIPSRLATTAFSPLPSSTSSFSVANGKQIPLRPRFAWVRLEVP